MPDFLLNDDQFILERPRLHALLEKNVKNSVVLVTAGGGYGKTYAVNSFLRSRNKTAAWLSLTERDNNPLHFWESVVKAISSQDPVIGKNLEEIGFPESPNQITRCLTLVGESIRNRKHFIIVVDDFHLIDEKSVIDFISEFISLPNPKETIIIISLTEPDFNTATLLSKGLLSRITVDDLRFNVEEIAAYFRLRNISLSCHEAKEIFAETEGWVLAISLIAEEMKNSRVKYSKTLLHEGSIRNMIDSLFASVPAWYQRFLITISHFDQWPLEVLSKISKIMRRNSSPHDQCEYLNRLSALYRYDVYLHGFRIHPLFLDYLREKQGEVSRHEIKTACSINAQWCMENRLLTDAAINYGIAGDYEGLLKAVYASPRTLSRFAAASFLEILERVFNDNGCEEDNKNFIYLQNVTRAWLLLNLGRFDESENILKESIRKFEVQPPGELISWILSSCYNTLGLLTLFVYRYTRDMSQTREYFLKGNYYYMLHPYTVSGPSSKICTGPYANLIGHPPKENEFEEFINTITLCIPDVTNSIGGYMGGGDSLCRAEFAFFRGELNAAEQHAREAVFKSREKGQYEVENKSLFYLLRICLCAGNINAGRETWRQIEAMLNISDYINRYAIYDIILGWVCAHTGATEQIALWIRNEFEPGDLNLNYQNFETMVKAKTLFAEKRYEEVLEFLDRKEVREGLGSFHLGLLEITVLQMAARSNMGDEPGALKTLETAYKMAVFNSIEMPFIELGDDMRFLTNTVLAALDAGTSTCEVPRVWLETIRNKASVYAKKLNTAVEHYHSGRTEEEKTLFLTSQELTILTGISRGLTREEIAQEVSLSLSTVKNSIKTIYEKLGAVNRADAIRIATGMKLLK